MPPKTKRNSDDAAESPMATDDAQQHTAALQLITSQLAHAELRACIANAGCENKNAKLIMMNSTAIPCCAERCREGEKKYTPVRLTLVHVQSAGFSVAPYSVPFGGGKGKVGENAKPLSVVEPGPVLRMWPFKKESVPGSRGPRYEDRSFVLNAGDTFVLFVSRMDFVAKPQQQQWAPESVDAGALFPRGVEEIPPFSLLEVHVTSKPGDPALDANGQVVQRASCLRFCTVRMATHSLYSYVSSLDLFAGSLDAARRAAFAKQETMPNISRDIQTGDVAFVLREVLPTANVCDDALDTTGFVSLVGWSADPLLADTALDISRDLLVRYTNAGSLAWAVEMLGVAVSLGCVRFLVFCSDYFQKEGLSHMRAVPVLDTRRLFASALSPPLSVAGATCEFDTGAVYRAPEDTAEARVLLSVEGELARLEGAPLCTHDLVLCSRSFDVPRALPFAFTLLAADGTRVPVLRGFVRVGGSPAAGGGGGGRKRVRLGAAGGLDA